MLRWTVRSDQIDLDRWATAVLGAQGAGRGASKDLVRWWTWPAILALVAALAVLLGAEAVVIGFAVPVVVIVGLIVVLNLTSERRLTNQLKRTPSTSEGFTFVADATGTSRSGPAGSDQLPWSRFEIARLDHDVITLLLDNSSVIVLPVAALDSTDAPGDAVAQINEWIHHSRSQRV